MIRCAHTVKSNHCWSFLDENAMQNVTSNLHKLNVIKADKLLLVVVFLRSETEKNVIQ